MAATVPFSGEVYLHWNTAANKGYVGQTTVGIDQRWKLHRRCSRSSKTPAYNTIFSKSLRKYGPNAFEHQILSTARSQAELDNLEKIWIILLQTKTPSGYNLADGGYAAAGHVVSPEVRIRLSEAGKRQWQHHDPRMDRAGKKQTVEHIAKRVRKMIGRKASVEEITKRIAKTTGLKRTDEFRAACSARMTGKKLSEETRLRMSIAQKTRQERGRTNAA